MRVRAPLIASVGILLIAFVQPAAAQTAGQQPGAIPDSAGGIAEFSGSAATPDPLPGAAVPRHPSMAANGRSNIHNDAYMSDTYRRAGPLGPAITASSAFFVRECGSITFDGEGRLVTVCVGLDRPVLAVLDPTSLRVLAALDLPARNVSLNPFGDFTGGGYFYLDNRDRVVVTTTTGHLLTIAVGGTGGEATLEVVRDRDLSAVVDPPRDAIISALPDERGRVWFATVGGTVGRVSRRGDSVASIALEGEGITNSFAVDPSGGVFIVSDAALYRFDSRRRRIVTTWRQPYANTGERKAGQSDAGSGTTPTLIGRDLIAITDNADPIQVVVYRRARRVEGKRRVCREPIFERGASATDQSLIAARRSIIAENNAGYTGPLSVLGSPTTAPGLTRVDLDRDGRGCRTVWTSSEIAPSVVPKLSLRAGLVYTYTHPPGDDDAWFLTALDFDDGSTVFKRLAGTGLGFNNNFAPVTLGPDGTAYVGVLGGVTRFSDVAG
jgi:hypothetical protein